MSRFDDIMKLIGYYSESVDLQRMLNGFEGGQFQIETRRGRIIRGEIREMRFSSDERGNHINVELKWARWTLKPYDPIDRHEPKWTLLRDFVEPYVIRINHKRFYFQKKWGRVKTWSELDEPCRFFPVDDHSNLYVCPSGEYKQVTMDWRFKVLFAALLRS